PRIRFCERRFPPLRKAQKRMRGAPWPQKSKYSPNCVNGRTTFNDPVMNCLRLLILSIAVILAGCATQPDRSASQSRLAYTAAETSRTIDLTHPPRDMWDRIRRGFAVPNLQTDLVDHWTQYYAARPESIRVMSQRAGKYLYHIVDELDRRGLPTELALLPFVESAYNPTALSRSQASGLWQFIPS